MNINELKASLQDVLDIFYEAHSSSNLVISFSASSRFFLYNNNFNAKKILLVTKRFDSFLSKIEILNKLLAEFIISNGIENVILVGPSKGGYATLLSGALLQARLPDKFVFPIAFSPQTCLYPYNCINSYIPSYARIFKDLRKNGIIHQFKKYGALEKYIQKLKNGIIFSTDAFFSDFIEAARLNENVHTFLFNFPYHGVSFSFMGDLSTPENIDNYIKKIYDKANTQADLKATLPKDSKIVKKTILSSKAPDIESLISYIFDNVNKIDYDHILRLTSCKTYNLSEIEEKAFELLHNLFKSESISIKNFLYNMRFLEKYSSSYRFINRIIHNKIDEAINLESEDSPVKKSAAELILNILFKDNEFNNYLKIYNFLNKKISLSSDLHIMASKSYMKINNSDGAVSCISDAVAKSDDFRLYRYYVHLLLKREKLAEAEDHANKLLALYPQKANAHSPLARVWLRKKEFKRASDLAHAGLNYGHSAELLEILASVSHHTSDFFLSLLRNRALAMEKPECAAAWINGLQAAAKFDDIDKDFWSKGIENIQNSNELLRYGDVLEANDLKHEALAAYVKSGQKKNRKAYLKAAELCLKLDDMQSAIYYANLAESGKSGKSPHFILAKASLKNKNYGKFVKNFMRGILK